VRPIIPRWQHIEPRQARARPGVAAADQRFACYLISFPLAALVILVVGRPVIWTAAVLPFGPFMLLLASRWRGTFAQEHAGEALAWTASLAVVGLGIGLSLTLIGLWIWGVVLLPVPLLGVLLLVANWIVLSLYGAAWAARQGGFSYPLTIPAFRGMVQRKG
jgi:hypothetical protein